MEDQKNVLLRFHLYCKLITYCDRAELKGILLIIAYFNMFRIHTL